MCCATWDMPTFEECAMMPAMVNRSPGDHSASWITSPPRASEYGMLYADIGVCPPCSNAAEAVITFAVEPGSKLSCRGISVVCATLVKLDGSYVGHCAIARIRPVCGWLSTSAAQACCASYCSAG